MTYFSENRVLDLRFSRVWFSACLEHFSLFGRAKIGAGAKSAANEAKNASNIRNKPYGNACKAS